MSLPKPRALIIVNNTQGQQNQLLLGLLSADARAESPASFGSSLFRNRGRLFILHGDLKACLIHNMYANTGNMYINQRRLSVWGLENAIDAISKKEPLFQSFRKHHMWWMHFWRNKSTFIIVEQRATGCTILLICFTWKQLEHWALVYISFSGNQFNWEPNRQHKAL